MQNVTLKNESAIGLGRYEHAHSPEKPRPPSAFPSLTATFRGQTSLSRRFDSERVPSNDLPGTEGTMLLNGSSASS